MCEYCGCQALSPIDELTREHDQVIDLISEVRSAAAVSDVPRMAELARSIAVVLGPHTQVEESGLFPAMAGDFPDQIEVLRSEHRQVEAVLAEAAAGTPSDPAWAARLTDALSVLRQHIFKEQDGVFPAALATLSGPDWETIEKVRADVGSGLEQP